jgi:hypothetical protein
MNVTLDSPTHICKNMNYRRNYRTDNVLPGQGYHIPLGTVTREFNLLALEFDI